MQHHASYCYYYYYYVNLPGDLASSNMLEFAMVVNSPSLPYWVLEGYVPDLSFFCYHINFYILL